MTMSSFCMEESSASCCTALRLRCTSSLARFTRTTANVSSSADGDEVRGPESAFVAELFAMHEPDGDAEIDQRADFVVENAGDFADYLIAPIEGGNVGLLLFRHSLSMAEDDLTEATFAAIGFDHFDGDVGVFQLGGVSEEHQLAARNGRPECHR